MYNYNGYGDYGFDAYSGFYPFHMFGFMILFWGAIIWTIVHFVKNNKHTIRHNSSAIDILKERYARGEISKEEFTEMKKDLN